MRQIRNTERVTYAVHPTIEVIRKATDDCVGEEDGFELVGGIVC